MEYSVPFNKVYISGNELQYIEESITNSHVSGDGPFTLRCHAWLKAYFGSPKSLITTSCTHALEISAMLLDIKPGDEVFGACQGTFTEYACADAGKLALKPANLTFEQAAAVPTAALTNHATH